MKKVFVSLVLLLIFFLPKISHGQIVISEIMYDLDGADTDREWIEIQNTGSTEVDIASYKFFEGNTNHGLVPDSSSKIPAGGYGIIVVKAESFKADWPNFNGLIFDSSFSLNNDPGENLAIKDSTGSIVDQVTYTADPTGAKAGKSLQKAGGTWVTAAPTVGAANATTSDGDASDDNADGSSGGSTTTDSDSPVKKTTEVTVDKISAEIILNTNAVVNKEIIFEPIVLGLAREKLNHGKFVWNFGDGFSITKSFPEKVAHTYKYAGDYVVILNYYSNPYLVNTLPDASDRVILTVQIHGLAITSFDKDGAVTLKNSDTKEFDLTNWSLKSKDTTFVFPAGTIILPGKSLTIPSENTGFTNQNSNSEIVLYFPNLTQAVRFPVKSMIVSNTSSTQKSTTITNSNTENLITEIIPEVYADSLSASVADAVPVDNKSSSKILPIILFGILIIGASAGVILLRRKNKNEEITADDIAIMDS